MLMMSSKTEWWRFRETGTNSTPKRDEEEAKYRHKIDPHGRQRQLSRGRTRVILVCQVTMQAVKIDVDPSQMIPMYTCPHPLLPPLHNVMFPVYKAQQSHRTQKKCRPQRRRNSPTGRSIVVNKEMILCIHHQSLI